MVSAIVVAAGSSRRMGFDKLAARFAGRSVLEHAVRALADSGVVGDLVVVTSDERWSACRGWVAEVTGATGLAIRQVPGGAERHDSVAAGLAALAPSTRLVAVHDGARPLVNADDIRRVVAAAAATGAATLAHPVVETLKRADAAGRVAGSVERTGVWAMETPQVFRHDWLQAAYAAARARGDHLTDEVSAIQAAGHPVQLVASTSINLKITHPHDLAVAERLIGTATPHPE